MDSFERFIELMRKTGDRCIILNAHGEPEYVIVSFSSYERLLAQFPRSSSTSKERKEERGLTEGQLLDKINRDIALWKEKRETMKKEHLEAWDAMMEHVQPLEGQENMPEEDVYEPEPLE